jgi:serine/threonine protein kinase
MQTILETCDSKYILLQEIGYGGTSSVYKGYSINDDSHKILAIKIFKEHHRKYFEKEISINNILPPKHFLSVINYGSGFIYKGNEYSLNLTESSNINNCSSLLKCKVLYKIEELAENGELFNYIYEYKKGFPEHISAKIFLKILKNVKIMHENNVIHGDIKPENILLDKDFNVKLIDFGFSSIITEKNHGNINSTEGSETYSAPERRRANSEGYDGVKSDIFSLGVLLFVITVGRFPFNMSGYSDKKYRLIITKKFDKYWAIYEKFNLSEEFKDLINHLICFEPEERLNIDKILEHSWIQKHSCSKDLNINEKKSNEDVMNELKIRKEYIEKKTN